MKILCLIIIPKGNFLQKNDMREKERARNSKEMSPSQPGRWGAPGGAGAPASLPVTSGGQWAGGTRPETQAFPERPRVSRACRMSHRQRNGRGEGRREGRRGRRRGCRDKGERNRGEGGEGSRPELREGD